MENLDFVDYFFFFSVPPSLLMCIVSSEFMSKTILIVGLPCLILLIYRFCKTS